MITKVNWTVFVSQTGSEVMSLARELYKVPSRLVTNNPKKLDQGVRATLEHFGCEVISIPFNPSLEHYLQEEILNSDLITLHGYLRIIPSEFIQRYSPKVIYNGHPGLITVYPELKGKDPQIRAWEGRYPTVGSVVHKVTEGVDEGEVVQVAAVVNEAPSLDSMYNTLRATSLRAWSKFFSDSLESSK